MFLSEFKQLLKQVKKDDYKDGIPKKVMEKCKLVFRDNAVGQFQKDDNHGRYALLSLLQNGIKVCHFAIVPKEQLM